MFVTTTSIHTIIVILFYHIGNYLVKGLGFWRLARDLMQKADADFRIGLELF